MKNADYEKWQDELKEESCYIMENFEVDANRLQNKTTWGQNRARQQMSWMTGNSERFTGKWSQRSGMTRRSETMENKGCRGWG